MTKTSPLQFARGVVLIMSFTIGILPIFVLMAPVFLTAFIHSVRVIRWRKWWADISSGIYLDFAGAMLMSPLTGTKVRLYSNDPSVFLNDRGVLLLSNHRCHIDWMYCGFVWCNTLFSNGALRFILKESIRGVPLFGWIMTGFMYIFLSRKNREADIEHIDNIMRYLINSGDRPTLVLFPEGTDLTDETIAKSQEYASKHGLPLMKYVLCPKISGVETVLNRLRGQGGAVHDLTLAYKDYRFGDSGDTRPSEVGMWSGEFPREVHMIVKRTDIKDIPTERTELERWVLNSFVQREKLLKGFYENGSVVPTADKVKSAKERLELKASLNEEADKKLAESEPWPVEISWPVRVAQPILTMVSLVTVFFASLIQFSWMRWFFIIIVIYCMVIRALFKGFDVLELKLHMSLMDRMEKNVHMHANETDDRNANRATDVKKLD